LRGYFVLRGVGFVCFWKWIFRVKFSGFVWRI